MKKKKYMQPKLVTHDILLEQSLAAGSTNIVFGGESPSNYPEIQGWEDAAGSTSGSVTLDGTN